ncbi:MAG: arsenosugar biosynthesis radical SAM protein ArsS [Nitrospirae bacterium]|nr:arsenosugar biosynthesis radical SAM protein ArsS [Nitrospirota bacterium]
MDSFDGRVEEATGSVLRCRGIDTIQVNLGLMCNQQCRHCHVSASPIRTESMDRHTMGLVADAVRRARPSLVDLTGGAPELNPFFREFVETIAGLGVRVQVRTNLTAMMLPGKSDLPGFLREHGAGLVASLPCYLEENVRSQRGEGVYETSVEAIRRLNSIGYGIDPALSLDLVYNPGGTFLPPGQAALEADYRRELDARFGISFSRLFTITNMPVGRYWAGLGRQEKGREYLRLLKESFNPGTLDGLMCRDMVSVRWDGALFDCDFNLALGLPVGDGCPGHVRDFDADALSGRRIVTGEHCFGCAAGCGSSCKGALV